MKTSTLIMEMETRELVLMKEVDKLTDRINEEDIRLTAEFPELEEAYYETRGELQEMRHWLNRLRCLHVEQFIKDNHVHSELEVNSVRKVYSQQFGWEYIAEYKRDGIHYKETVTQFTFTTL